ncbi:MAG TPA: hypothetical protein DD670_03665 [Planctomycetaceae bacterium]|nr:hypothetical protein [Planctomycetaceae bacterium]
MESLSVLVTPHPAPFEHWFEAAVKRKAHEEALEISDRARRHRFLGTLPYGGRLDSLRWILDGPEEFLDAQGRLLRRDLLLSLRDYDRASKEAAAARQRLAQLPPVAADAQAGAIQGKELADLAAISVLQETLLREVAVSRQPSDLVFPPLRRTADLRKALPDGSAVLAFFATSRGTYAFLIDNTRYDYWAIGNMASLNAKLKGFLRDLGLFDANREVAMNALGDAKWKQSGAEVLELILKDSRADFTSHFDELIVVPDGLLWYVPFESLQVVVDGQSESLISRFRIRYAPTIGLAVPDGRRRKAVGRTGVALGRLFPGDADAVAQTAFDEFARAVPGAAAFSSRLPAPSSIYRVVFDSLVVLGDSQAGKEGVYSWEPIPVESPKKGGNALGDWIRLPLGGPQTVVLPGFHTATESGLKRYDAKMPGREVFLSACGLMAGGTRTVLLSRWRTGGQVSFDLVREFVQELPHTTPAEAWQRAVLLARESRIDPAMEPRVGAGTGSEPPKAEHPFFWAGYMLIDPGDMPGEAPAAAAPGIDVPAPEAPAPEAPAPEAPAPEVPSPEVPAPDPVAPVEP